MRETKNTHPISTYLLLAINILVYLYLAIKGGSLYVIDDSLMNRYGFRSELFLGGAYWQLITNMFAHFDLPHLGYNMLFLAFFGSKAEDLFGRAGNIGLYLFFGATTTMTAFIYPLGTVSAGASGAIFGLLGADLSAQRGLYPNRIWSALLYGAVFFLLAAATGFLAHLVGLIIGFITGYLASRDWYPDEGDEETETDIELFQ